MRLGVVLGFPHASPVVGLAEGAQSSTREGSVSLHRKYLRILSALAPTGAASLSILLASGLQSDAREHPAGTDPAATPAPRVSERLDAIRCAMSEVTSGPGVEATVNVDGDRRLAWFNGGWGNGGIGIFLGPAWNDWNNWHNWPNWHNWSNGWGNFGWHNW